MSEHAAPFPGSWVRDLFVPNNGPSATSKENPEAAEAISFGLSHQNSSSDTQKRSQFGTKGCTVYGWPLTGGVQIKEADMVDLQHLGLSRFASAQRSPDTADEDAFCQRIRNLGATWWTDEQGYTDCLVGARERTAQQRKIMIYGWPSNGQGVWLLVYESEQSLPEDFGRVHFAVNMQERRTLMRVYGAKYYADSQEITELHGLV